MQEESLEQIDLNISGMTCSSCVATVEKSLNKVPGAKATVNLATETAHILVPEGTSPKSLIEAVTKAGYTAKLRTDETESFSRSRGMGIRVLLSALLTIPVVVLSMWHSVHHKVDDYILEQLRNLNIPEPLYSATGWLVIGLTAPVVLIIAWPIHRAALRNLTHPTMDNLISLGALSAFSWSIYANSTGAGDIYAEVAASVVTFIVLGRYLESRAKKRAGSALAHLLSLNPKEVTILRGGEEIKAPIANLQIGDRCVVRPGDRIPTDGVIIEGVSAVDNSLLTGESLPVDVHPGTNVIAGAINTSGRLVIEARRIGNDTELARITKMVLTAQGEKAPIQKLVDRISSVFVPIVIALSIATFAAWYFLDNPIQDAVRAAVAVLVIACPCALGLATPVALLVATGKGASQGIVLRKTSSLEIAPKITTVVLDKTGTLTTGVMKVQSITVPDLGKNSPGISQHDLLMAVHSLENESSHPIAGAITRYLSDQGIGRKSLSDFVDTPGQGVAARVSFGESSLPVLIGTPESIRRATVSLHPDIEAAIAAARLRGNSLAVVAVDGVAVAVFEVGDSLRSDAAATIKAFQEGKIQIWLITGDNEAAAHQIALEVGIPTKNVIALATPERKIAKIKELRASGEKVLMIGDGINDAAAIAEADLSMALGTGTDTAIASADITLLRNTLGTAISAINLAKSTLRIIRGNLGWAFIYNLIGIPIAALGLLNPMYAGGAMAASSLFVVLNSLRLNRTTTLAA
ncbi:MAG: heavy metal translocating P-type ATPase [Candidatus Nanopelagicaceae bacterium]|nr:heavy metal translocating P-type ATPase [Candidatus Nanopelagicaceae bacterium]